MDGPRKGGTTIPNLHGRGDNPFWEKVHRNLPPSARVPVAHPTGVLELPAAAGSLCCGLHTAGDDGIGPNECPTGGGQPGGLVLTRLPSPTGLKPDTGANLQANLQQAVLASYKRGPVLGTLNPTTSRWAIQVGDE